MSGLTILNSMASNNFVQSLDLHKQWGITQLDLKDNILGKTVDNLDVIEAKKVNSLIQERGMSVYCLSTSLYAGYIEEGERFFQREYLDNIYKILETAYQLKPKVIRLMAAKSHKRSQYNKCTEYLKKNEAWLIPAYQQAIDQISSAGYEATVENQPKDCILSHPEEILDFFKALNRSNKVFFTYDIQNLWEMGTLPSLEVYKQIASITGYVHIKGGQQGAESQELHWKTTLEDASWPVEEVTREVIKAGNSPMICINPSHGKNKPDYDYNNIVERDIQYITKIFPELT